jgi:AraC-like DNA-binding protein
MASETVSVRMLWPFMRLLRDFGPETSILQAAGVDPATLADPDARIPRLVVGNIIFTSQTKTGDAAIGIHAGERTESADFGVLDHVVRNCPDLRRALQCTARYMRLQDDNIEGHLIEDGDRAIWQIRNAIPTVLRVTNDYQVTVTLMNLRRRLGRHEAPLEVHLRHHDATDAAEYARVFQAPVRFDQPHNAVVIRRELLDAPVASANPDAFSVFEIQAARLLNELSRRDTTMERITRLLLQRIGQEDIGIDSVAHALDMSVSTLRRRLVDEGTTYRTIVDELRQRLALQYVANRRIAIGEIAFLLGFSTQSAFGTAFRRWMGASPLEYRLQAQRATAAS